MTILPTSSQPLFGADIPTQAQINRRRRLAEALRSNAFDTSPVGSWTQALARVVEGGVAGMNERSADKADTKRSQALAAAIQGGADPSQFLVAGEPDIANYLSKQNRYGVEDSQWQKEYDQRAQLAKERMTQSGSGGGLYQAFDADGNLVYLQTNKSGGAQPIPNYTPAPPLAFPNTGTSINPTNTRTGQPGGPTLPINNQQKAFDTETGKSQAETSQLLPQAAMVRDQTLAQIDQVANHPSLDMAVGNILGRIPDAAMGLADPGVVDFRNRVQQLVGQSFLTAYSTLKGGGQIANLEGEKAQKAIYRMNLAVDEKSFKQALIDYKTAINAGFAAMQKKAAVQSTGGNEPLPTNPDDPLGLNQ